MSLAASAGTSPRRASASQTAISISSQVSRRRSSLQIAAISGNPIFVSISEAMLGWLKAYHTELLLWSGKETYTLAEHMEIVDAIAKGDADAAEAAMVQHLQRSSGLYGLKG